MYEITDTGYGMNVNRTEFASLEEWIEWESQDSDGAPLTSLVDNMKGGNDAENRYELCPGEAV